MNIYARVASENMKETTEKLGKELWETVASPFGRNDCGKTSQEKHIKGCFRYVRP